MAEKIMRGSLMQLPRAREKKRYISSSSMESSSIE
jgi:hypothetical protein